MLVHHSLRSSERGAAGRSSTSALPTRNDSTTSAAGGRSSPLKFFSSSSRSQQASTTAGQSPTKPMAKNQDQSKQHGQLRQEDHGQTQQAQPVQVQTDPVRKRWTADYLTELRKPVGARPMGARPPPGRNVATALDVAPRASSALADHTKDNKPDVIEKLKRSISPFGSQRSHSAASRQQEAGRPLARAPDMSIMEDIATTNAKADKIKVDIDGKKAAMPYYERGQRWMEKQEAKSLRAAMVYMDRDEDKRVHDAAQEEAADLVWKHKYPEGVFENPEAFKMSLREHLKQGSHARSQSIGPFETLYVAKGGAVDGKRSASDGSTSNKSDSSQKSSSNRVVSTSSKGSSGSGSSSGSRRSSVLNLKTSAGKILGSMRKSTHKSRRASNARMSGVFSNPTDRIYEEPESITETPQEEQQDSETQGPLKPKTRNTSGSYRPVQGKEAFSPRVSLPWGDKVSSVDIHKNAPSQSRDPTYLSNTATTSEPTDQAEEQPPTKNGIEIRSDEIRAATSRRWKDRSESLPKPTYVSESPGRPIVSFDTGYHPKDPKKVANGRPGSRDAALAGARPMPGKPQMPAATASAPTVPRVDQSSMPTITLGDVPSINIDSSPDIPQINVSGPPIQNAPSPAISVGRPAHNLPPANRPSPRHTNTAPASNPVLRGHWSPAISRVRVAACCTCGLHIQGRTLSASNQRFHPECFNCFQCGTNLEHVAFYPEPENAKEERFAQEDADSISRELDQRFFCHLDFHELFSPRCKSCKTPIEGEVILACGSQWHQGHFFCAQCGDPFDGTMPFIEKDGWAWCVGCYKGRYSGKCRGCKKPVTEDGVQALGAEWHADCFRCNECNGPFEDGKFFTRGAGEGPVCMQCEERRLKA